MGKKFVVLLKKDNVPMIFDNVTIEDLPQRLKVHRQNEGTIAEFDKDTIQRWHLEDSN